MKIIQERTSTSRIRVENLKLFFERAQNVQIAHQEGDNRRAL